MYKVVLMLKIETSLYTRRTERSTRDGKLSMLMSMRRSQLRDNSTRSSDFTLRETSTLFQDSQTTDTST
jgi:hypothetical protein